MNVVKLIEAAANINVWTTMAVILVGAAQGITSKLMAEHVSVSQTSTMRNAIDILTLVWLIL